jgi:S1 RNA binding domain protein
VAQDDRVPEPLLPAEADQPASQQPQESPEPPDAPQPVPEPAPPVEAPAEPPKPAHAEAEPGAKEAEAPGEEVKLAAKGDIVEATVRRIAPFGAFVRLADGRKGLIHISQVAEEFVNEIKDHIKVGQVVRARITAISDDGKVDLSIKKAKARPKPERPPRPKRRKRPERDRADAKLPKPAPEFHVNPLADVFVDVEKKLK